MDFRYLIFVIVSISISQTSGEAQSSYQQNIPDISPEQNSIIPNLENVKSVKIENGYTGILFPQKTIDKAETYLEAIGISKGIVEYVKIVVPKVAKSVLKYAVKIGAIAVTAILIILITSSIATAFCSYSELCSLKFNSSGWENDHLEESVRSLLTQDKISTLTSFVHNAISKYTNMQKRKTK